MMTPQNALMYRSTTSSFLALVFHTRHRNRSAPSTTIIVARMRKRKRGREPRKASPRSGRMGAMQGNAEPRRVMTSTCSRDTTCGDRITSATCVYSTTRVMANWARVRV
jgi:hypothetical protein